MSTDAAPVEPETTSTDGAGFPINPQDWTAADIANAVGIIESQRQQLARYANGLEEQRQELWAGAASAAAGRLEAAKAIQRADKLLAGFDQRFG